MRIILVWIPLLFFSLARMTGWAQKIALVDIDSVINSLPETAIAKGKLDSMLSRLQQKFDLMSDSMKLLYAQVPHGEASESEKKAYVKKVNDLQNRIFDFQKKASNELECFRQALRAPIESKVKKQSIELARSEHYFALVENSKQDLGYRYTTIQPVDITTLVIRKLAK